VSVYLLCRYDEEHEYPDDWTFGGTDGNDPRADPRWQPTIYSYLDDHLVSVHTTITPLCDEEALDEFTKVCNFGDLHPVYLEVKRPSGEVEVLPFRYLESEDTLYPIAEPGNG